MEKKFILINESHMKKLSKNPTQICLPGKFSSQVLVANSKVILPENVITERFKKFIDSNKWLTLTELDSYQKAADEKATTQKVVAIKVAKSETKNDISAKKEEIKKVDDKAGDSEFWDELTDEDPKPKAKSSNKKKNK